VPSSEQVTFLSSTHFAAFIPICLQNEITFAVEAVIVVFVHGPCHSEIGQFGHPIRVDQTIATSHVSVDRFMGKKEQV